MTTDIETERFVLAAVNQPTPWDATRDADAVWSRILFHGVAAQIALTAGDDWPDAIRAALRQQALAQTMWDMRHAVLMRTLCNHLAEQGVRAAFLKGTALAYSVYDQPALRSRGDSDIVVAPADLPKAREALIAAGFVPLVADKGDDEYQEDWTWSQGNGQTHNLDLHWASFNSPVLARTLPAQRLLDDAVPLPAIGPTAMRVSDPDALLHACLHRMHHAQSPYYIDGMTYYSEDRLIWLLDIDLLVRRLDPAGTASFVAMAQDSGTGNICAHCLQNAHDRLNTPLDPQLMTALRAIPDGAAARILAQDSAGLRALENIRAAGGGMESVRFALRRIFPSRAFMQAKYAQDGTQPSLAVLYLRRIIRFLRQAGKA